MSLASILDEIRERKAFWLSGSDLADTFSPDSLESPGADFLHGVRDAFIEAVEYLDDPTADDIRDLDAHEYADSAVPVYTHRMWLTFVDLGAHQEEIDDLGEIRDMGQGAAVALYMIAERLFTRLAHEVADSLEAEAEAVAEVTDLLDTNPWDQS